jgi:hypothetical protein
MTRTANMTTTNTFEGRARRWLIVLALAGSSTLAGACDRAHLSSYYGQSFNAWFAMQHVRNRPADSDATKRALSSLDAQEAAAISKNYRRTVGAGENQGQGQMVMVGQNHGGSVEASTPPPSVPGGQ